MDEDKVRAIVPKNFKKELTEYLSVIRRKKSEYDKRAYMKSVILERFLGVNPAFISYESDRIDLYYAGVLVETKIEIKKNTLKDAFEEISRYIKKRLNTVRAIITDGIIFRIYDPSYITHMVLEGKTEELVESKKYEEVNLNLPSTIDSSDYLYLEEKLFTQIYNMFYPDVKFSELEEDVITARLISLVQTLAPKVRIGSQIKFTAWKKFVSIAFGNEREADEDVYRRYVVLYYVTVLLVAKVLGIEASLRDKITPVAYASRGIINFIEPDGFFDILDEKSPIIAKIEDELSRYAFVPSAAITDEVYRLLYENLITPNERHDLGEFYTPSWLAQILVNEAVKTGNETIIDPACGSGTFVRLSLKKIREKGGTGRVVGFDINPIAVHIARANYITEEPETEVIPIFMADSLMPNYEMLRMDQKRIDDLKAITIDFSGMIGTGRKVSFYFRSADSIQDIDRYLTRLMEEVDKAEKNEHYVAPELFRENEPLIKAIAFLKKNDQNHIWLYILRNIYTPYYMVGKADIVIGNPPWLTYKDINSTRQKLLDKLYREYSMGAGGHNKTQQDMAGFILSRSMEFLKSDGKIFFVLTRSIMNGAQYNGLRLGRWGRAYDHVADSNKPTIRIATLWDIANQINPFRKPSCMAGLIISSKTIDKIQGYLIEKTENDSFKIVERSLFVNKTKNYSSISYVEKKTGGQSPYHDLFHNGATIFPRPYFFVSIDKEEKNGSLVSTLPEYRNLVNKRTRKGDFKVYFDREYVPNRLLFNVVLGKDIDKYKLKSPHKAVLPITQYQGNRNSCIFVEEKIDGGFRYKLIDQSVPGEGMEKQALSYLYKSYENKFNDLEKDWERYRGNKFDKGKKASSRASLWAWLNMFNKLTKQNPFKDSYAVVYNESGTTIRCAVVNGKNTVFEHTCYYYYANSADEAYYLAGILNSEVLMDELKEYGILSERHIEKKPFDISVPKFESKNKEHLKISNLAREISESLASGGALSDDDNRKRIEGIGEVLKVLLFPEL